jgi:hypothetical protein
VASVEKILQEMRNNPKGIRFNDLKKVCEHYFGDYTVSGSHHVFRTGLKNNPRVNIQSRGGYGKDYQVRQTIVAIDEKKGERHV